MLAGFANSGSWVGNIIGLPLAGYLCINGFNSGWPSIFYLYGALCAAWSIVFFFICSDNPETHRFISVAERNFIVQELSKVRANNKKRTPWIKFFLSKACWAIYVAHFCSNFGIYLFLTSLPTFLKDVLKFDIKSVS
jgi:ACS family sodium-dependent inorganic phosphate cotransporter-like MFS transporter 5